MPAGKLARWFPDSKYGFVQCGEQQAYMHASNFRGLPDSLAVGDTLRFELVSGQNGKMRCVNIERAAEGECEEYALLLMARDVSERCARAQQCAEVMKFPGAAAPAQRPDAHATGVLLNWNEARGFGYLLDGAKKRVWFHAVDLTFPKECLRYEMKLTFKEVDGRKGRPRAVGIRQAPCRIARHELSQLRSSVLQILSPLATMWQSQHASFAGIAAVVEAMHDQLRRTDHLAHAIYSTQPNDIAADQHIGVISRWDSRCNSGTIVCANGTRVNVRAADLDLDKSLNVLGLEVRFVRTSRSRARGVMPVVVDADPAQVALLLDMTSMLRLQADAVRNGIELQVKAARNEAAMTRAARAEARHRAARG